MGSAVSSLTSGPSSLTGGATGIIGGLRGVTAINRAKNHQVAGNKEAQNQLNPYMDTGKQANSMLSDKLGSGQLGGTFTPGDLTQDPGYQFRLQQGEEALGRKQSAGGSVFSGAALKQAQQYGQGLADQTYNDAFNRWRQEQDSTYGMLSGQSAQGLGAANNWGGYATNIGDINANAVIAKENARMGMLNSLGNMSLGK